MFDCFYINFALKNKIKRKSKSVGRRLTLFLILWLVFWLGIPRIIIFISTMLEIEMRVTGDRARRGDRNSIPDRNAPILPYSFKSAFFWCHSIDQRANERFLDVHDFLVLISSLAKSEAFRAAFFWRYSGFPEQWEYNFVLIQHQANMLTPLAIV